MDDKVIIMTPQLLRQYARDVIREYQQQIDVDTSDAAMDDNGHDKQYGRGIKVIREMFGVSYAQAHKYKETFLAPAISQVGKVITVNIPLARKLFKEHRTTGARHTRRCGRT